MPSTEQLRSWRLGAYAYTTLPRDHPRRAELRPDYLAALSRHIRMKAELLPLVRAWREAGVDVLLYKGFYLAEFVYPVPGARFHGDVDVLLRPEQAGRALEVALAAGWRLRLDACTAPRSDTHAAFIVNGPGRVVQVDAHRLAVHSSHRWNRIQRRITEQVWESSRERAWEGTTIREMSPADVVIVGTALERSWSSDRWRMKPADPVDFWTVATVLGVAPGSIRARARELRCTRTVEIFLERCGAESRQPRLEDPSAAERRRWDRKALLERGPLGRLQRALRLLSDPRPLACVVHALRPLVRVRRALRGERDLRSLLSSLEPRPLPPAPGALERRQQLVRGVRWAVRLLPTNPAGDCVARSLTLYHLLRREGWPVVFVSGVARSRTGITGHAWLELDGEPLFELGESDVRSRYAVNFRYPGPAAAGEGAGSDPQGTTPQDHASPRQAPE